uniref:hypothetical protein n=1 Tax=Rhizobium halophilum TaxID=2846852 RepID=UPI00374DC578
MCRLCLQTARSPDCQACPWQHLFSPGGRRRPELRRDEPSTAFRFRPSGRASCWRETL